MNSNVAVDFVIPLFNEGSAVRDFHRELTEAIAGLPYVFGFLYVNDGSTDETGEVLDSLSVVDTRVHQIRLSRNFGHQAALAAGLEASDADALIMMDGDGEHPPRLAVEMLRRFEEGYDIIQARRLDKARSGFLLKTLASRSFYWLINRMGETKIAEGSADFRLLSKQAANALRQLPESHRFYRGMVQWIGYRSMVLPYAPANRIGGRSKYSLRKMLRLAADGIFSFSLVPLRIGLFLGVLFLLLGGGEMIYVLSFVLRGEASNLVPGWSSLMLMLTISSGISMLLTGILGIYVGMIFQEVKRRPVYLVKNEERSFKRIHSLEAAQQRLTIAASSHDQ